MLALLWAVACAGGVRGDKAEGLVLNEVLARNLNTNLDGAGDADDWLEIWNGGDQPVSRKNLAISDDPDTPDRFLLPDGDPIAPGSFLLIWCDGDPEQGDQHADFKLSGLGESVYLTYVDRDEPILIDEVDFGEQTVDQSWARVSDGDPTWGAATPTPGESNGQ